MRELHRGELIEAAAQGDEERYQNEVLTALRERVKVDIPELMIERDLDRQVAEMEVRMAALGIPFDRYLEYSGTTAERFRQDRRAVAVQRVRLDLALTALAAAEQLEVDESQVEREAQRIAAGRRVTPDQRRRLRTAARQDLLRQAAVGRAVEIARGNV
jgi:trigger factor